MNDEDSKKAIREVVALGASVSAANLDKYRETFRNLLDSGVRELVLDCSQLEVVDSMGIGLLVATHNSLSKADGQLVLTETNESIYKLMSVMRLNRHFTVEKK